MYVLLGVLTGFGIIAVIGINTILKNQELFRNNQAMILKKLNKLIELMETE